VPAETPTLTAPGASPHTPTPPTALSVQRGDLGEALDRPARAVDADRRPPLTRLQRLDA
jgi:hypothetical protein